MEGTLLVPYRPERGALPIWVWTPFAALVFSLDLHQRPWPFCLGKSVCPTGIGLEIEWLPIATHSHTYIHTYIHIYIYTHIYIYIYIYIYISKPLQKYGKPFHESIILIFDGYCWTIPGWSLCFIKDWHQLAISMYNTKVQVSSGGKLHNWFSSWFLGCADSMSLRPSLGNLLLQSSSISFVTI